MSLRRRLFITFGIVVLLGFLSTAKWIRGELRNSYSQIAEEILVDNAYMIAAFLENNQMSTDSLAALEKMFTNSKFHSMNAKIFDFVKTNSNLGLYITNENGIVVFSTNKDDVGRDFSKWNDVYKTLHGEYGARSTRVVPDDPLTSVFYVSAPVIINTKIVGVASIFKTESSILVFLDKALNRMFLGGFLSALVLAAIGGLIVLWITLPLERLRKYAIDVSEGRRSLLPVTKVKEVRQLGDAFEKMRVSLEGKKTIEKYTQTLTHELKSPLTAIKGAAELCLEEMDQVQRQLFLKNIINEASRSHILLEQLLKIAALESKSQLEQVQSIDVVEILNESKEALIGLWKPKNLKITIEATDHCLIQGDRFLLFQALRNLMQNAIEFSNSNSSIQITVKTEISEVIVEMVDEGIGIPEYAIARIFEKFYSLERPDTKRKSSGLGLSFVKEVIELHNGKISVLSPVKNNIGTKVTVNLPNWNH